MTATLYPPLFLSSAQTTATLEGNDIYLVSALVWSQVCLTLKSQFARNLFFFFFIFSPSDAPHMWDVLAASRRFQSETQMAPLLANTVTLFTKLLILWDSFTSIADRTVISTLKLSGEILKWVSVEEILDR